MKKTTITLLLSLSCCWLAAQCPTGDITFSTQGQIDSFQINYPGCKHFVGNVTIGGYDISNLNGLLGIQSIAGSLHVGGTDNGLGPIYLNPLLLDLHGLDSLSLVGGDLSIYGNNKLKTLNGLERLDSVGSRLVIGNLWDDDPFANDELESIAALANLSKFSKDLYITANLLLHNLHGLENIRSLRYLRLERCNLDSLHGLSSLQTIEDFYFENNWVDNFNGLNSLQSILDDFVIIGNNDLKNFQGLEKLKSIGYIGSLSYLKILNNQNLESLTGLDSVDLSPVEMLTISSNPQLSFCNTPSICDYLANSDSIVLFNNNAPGCNSIAEIEAACIVSIEETADGEPVVIFSPNPATDFLQIQINDPEKWEISLFDLQGRQMFRQKVSGSQIIEVKDCISGVYTLSAVSGKRVFAGKIVKQ